MGCSHVLVPRLPSCVFGPAVSLIFVKARNGDITSNRIRPHGSAFCFLDSVKGRVGHCCAIVTRAVVAGAERVVFADCGDRTVRFVAHPLIINVIPYCINTKKFKFPRPRAGENCFGHVGLQSDWLSRYADRCHGNLRVQRQ